MCVSVIIYYYYYLNFMVVCLTVCYLSVICVFLISVCLCVCYRRVRYDVCLSV